MTHLVAPFLTQSVSSELILERVITAGTGITLTDGGPGGALTIAATSGAGNLEPAAAAPGNQGSLTLLAGTVTIQDDSNCNAFPGHTTDVNGRQIAVYRKAASHVDSKGVIAMHTSTNGGGTWSAQSTIYTDATYDSRDPSITRLASGRLVICFFLATFAAPSARILDGVRVIYSDDNAGSWSSPITVNSAFTKEEGCSAPIIQLPDGTLRLAIYGRNTSDSYDSVTVFSSSDEGETWGTEISIANGQTDSQHYQEPNLVFLHDGRLMCLMRSDTPNQASGLIWQSYSSDQGATWTTPKQLWSGTGSPRTIQLKNGMLLYIARRASDNRGIWRSSRDGGYSWTAEAVFDITEGDSLAYAAPYEYKEGLIGVVYGYEFNYAGTNGDILYKQFYTTTEGGQLVANVPTGTAPLVVQSTTMAPNLNADMLDGLHASEIVSLTRWEPVTNGDVSTPEIVFYDGDVVMAEVAN